MNGLVMDGVERVETLGKHIEEVFTNFPQHQPLTLEGLQSEWVQATLHLQAKWNSNSSNCIMLVETTHLAQVE